MNSMMVWYTWNMNVDTAEGFAFVLGVIGIAAALWVIADTIAKWWTKK